MKTKIGLIIFLLTSIWISNAQTTTNRGTIKESLTLSSKTLGRDIKYSVYLPADYTTSIRSYPVLYLLHGYSDNETSWIQFGEIEKAIDKLTSQSEFTPMIIVMPDAGETWYINNYDTTVRYEDAFFTDFIPTIEKIYRIRATKEFRAIAGLSMGGYGSLLYAMKHSDKFAACLAFSSAVYSDSFMKNRLKLGERNSNNCYGKLNGDELPKVWKMNSVLELASILPVSNLNALKYYIDCGDKDALILGNSQLNLILNERNVMHEFRVRAGKHEWTYWRQSIDDGLRFLTPIFSR